MIPANSLNDAVKIATMGRLMASVAAIYTRDVNRAFHAINEMYTGISTSTHRRWKEPRYTYLAERRPLGNGHREVGTQVLDIFSEWKSIYVDYSGKLQRARLTKEAVNTTIHVYSSEISIHDLGQQPSDCWSAERDQRQ